MARACAGMCVYSVVRAPQSTNGAALMASVERELDRAAEPDIVMPTTAATTNVDATGAAAKQVPVDGTASGVGGDGEMSNTHIAAASSLCDVGVAMRARAQLGYGMQIAHNAALAHALCLLSEQAPPGASAAMQQQQLAHNQRVRSLWQWMRARVAADADLTAADADA
jgi:hypothetical protein